MTLFDTNVLVYSLNEDAPQHPASRLVVDAALDRRLPAVLTPQVMLETLAIVTDARRFPHALAPRLAWEQLQALMSALPVLEVGRESLRQLGHLLAEHPVGGADVFDTFLAAQMRSHGVTTVCTYDAGVFARLSGVELLTPERLGDRYGLRRAR